eukprot:Nitzschia sp. Nitz4//scaffold84_size84139//36979//38914//NITZ4_005196-RA/size84139-augustus-gene-0.38-mRNA-1//1//CDS//3329559027//9193//frame0
MFHCSRTTLRAMSRRKTLAQAKEQSDEGGSGLRRSLNAVDLVLFGVGSSVGAGVYVLVGIGTKIAGPSIALSFLGCGLSCILTSLAYADFASRIPASGSAFTYVYVAFGEFYAWLVGFCLILGYGFTASVTARAWGDYTGTFLARILPGDTTWVHQITEFPLFGPDVDYTCSPLSVVIIGFSTAVLLRGAKDSTTFNNCMTVANLMMLFLVVASGLFSGSVSTENLTPFAPHGVSGVLAGAGLVFFAFIGFDQVASLSEEVIHPERNMPIGIVGSLVVSTLIYVIVAFAVVGMTTFRYLGETVPIINALMVNACCSHTEQVQATSVDICLEQCEVFQKPILQTIAHIVSGGAIFGLMASCFTSLMGQPRIFYRMSLDGLWFPVFAEIHPVTNVPSRGIQVTGVVCAFLACFVPLEALANLISLGTLMVFTFVDAGVVILRLREVTDMICNRIHNPLERSEERIRMTQSNQWVVLMLLVFSVSLMGASATLRNSDSHGLVALQFILALVAAFGIASWPPTWTVRDEENLSSVGHAKHFECPWVPFTPLCGVACNCIMMGSLPLSSWLFCGGWLGLAVMIYFSYGIHHSALGKPSSMYSDTVPLMETGVSSYKSHTQDI